MERIALFLVVAAVGGCITGCMGYGIGAPPVACVHMTPGHLYQGNASWPLIPQEVASPFTVTASTDEFGHGGQVEVTIDGSENFIGFLLEARQVGADEPVGAFSGLDTSTHQFVACSETYPEATVTHRNTDAFESGVTLTWTAPNEDIGNVIFYATVAKDHDNYWVKLESETVTFSGFTVLSPVLCMVLLPVLTMLVRLL